MVAVTSNITIGGLKMKQHPSNKRILRDFIDYLEDDNRRSSWRLISSSTYESTRTNSRKRRQERSQNSNRQHFKVYLEWHEMGETDLDFEIESFLKLWNEN